MESVSGGGRVTSATAASSSSSDGTLSGPVVGLLGGHDGGPAVIATAVPGAANVPMELVTAAAARAIVSSSSQLTHQDINDNVSGVPVYVESTGELVAAAPGQTVGGAGGLQLTTITVAVPAPLSPTDPALLAAAAAANQPPPMVTLPTVPAPQESAFKWKYEQNKEKASGTSLVRRKSTKAISLGCLF